jgi:hypothetical protein
LQSAVWPSNDGNVKSSLLFLVFNRPDTTRKVFEAIRAGRPPRLYVAADGPRKNRLGEAGLSEEVRSIATGVDWPCEVKTLFRDENLGCKRGVSSGIDWFFEHESEGVILEDDVLPIQTFFPFCDELLERYRNDHRVAMITGCNLVARYCNRGSSYLFSRYNHIWGWASWRRAWQYYDVTMAEWPAWRDAHGLAKMPGATPSFAAYWRYAFDTAYGNRIDTWDYQWTFACWRVGALTAMPVFNQTQNLGFGAGATHTTGAAPDFIEEAVSRPLAFPLNHPHGVQQDLYIDKKIDSIIFKINLFTLLKRRLFAFGFLRKSVAAFKQTLKIAAR